MLSIPVPTGLLPVGVDTHTLEYLLSPFLCQQMAFKSFAFLFTSMGAALFHDNTLRPLVAVGPPFTTPGLGMLLPDSSAVGVVICIYRFNLYLHDYSGFFGDSFWIMSWHFVIYNATTTNTLL